VLIITATVGCAVANKPISVEELLELGEKYLLELNYEQAVVQFLKVIDIEPMNARGYIGAAEAYIGLGEEEKAIDILRQGLKILPDNQTIQDMLDALINSIDIAGGKNYISAEIAVLFKQLSEAMKAGDYDSAYQLCMERQLIDFSKEERTVRPKCYDVFISSPNDNIDYFRGLGEMVSAHYLKTGEEDNSRYVLIREKWDTTSNFRIGYIVEEYDISNGQPNGEFTLTYHYLIEEEYTNPGVQTSKGKYINGLEDGETVTLSNAAKNGFWKRSDVYSMGKYIQWIDEEGNVYDVPDGGISEKSIEWELYQFAMQNWKIVE